MPPAAEPPKSVPRYRFNEFVLSPRRRMLLRNGCELPLIPRYFDLLVFLVERRGEAVHRREIFDRIWSDAVVSDSALSQAIRTIRRALGDDSREPRFVRTVSRHGYRFVFTDVIEEDETEPHAPHGSVETPPQPGTAAAATEQRLSPRWTDAAVGGGTAGMLAGLAGALILIAAPGGVASFAIAPVLMLVGGCCGGAGAAGVGAGLSIADSLATTRRGATLVAGAALGGAVVGTTVQWLSRWTLAALVGVHLDTGGGVEGLAIGAAAGLGFAVATSRRRGGFPAWARIDVVNSATACGVTALALAAAGRPLVGGTLDAIAKASVGAQATLTPLGRLIGEPDFGPRTAALLATGEGAVFGAGIALGLRRRPQPVADAAH